MLIKNLNLCITQRISLILFAFKRIFLLFIAIFAFFLQNAISAELNENADDAEFAEFDTPQAITPDPYEPINRKIFAFNMFFDDIFLVPVTRKYISITSDDFRGKVSNFLTNFLTPYSVIISTSQADSQSIGILSWRFIINTTLGVFGIFDVASELGLRPIDKHFSDSLALYGVPMGNYITLPFLGPSFMRSAIDFPMGFYLNGLFNTKELPIAFRFLNKNSMVGKTLRQSEYNYIVFPFKALDLRAGVLNTTDDLNANSLDRYKAYRDMYFQFATFSVNQRLSLIKNGTYSSREFQEFNINSASNKCLLEPFDEDCQEYLD